MKSDTIWRYERKYLIEKYNKKNLETLLKNNKFLFKKKFQERKVRSIYFDDLDFNSYYQNIQGLSNRTKYRLRWYGDTFKESLNAQFELKIKNNKTNSKEIYKVNKIHFDINDNEQIILKKTLNAIDNKELCIMIKNLKPITFVEYERKYYESFCKNIRITFDSNLSFRRASNPIIKNSLLNYEVVEIKYSEKNEEEFFKFIPYFKRRSSRNSKYVNSIHNLSIL